MSLSPSNGKTLLVTGINGYIASSLGELILSKGYNLRGTSRSLHSTDPLVNGALAAYSARIEILEVPDMTIPGAFDKAVKGVHGIFHTASPISFKLQTYEEVVIPAVAGTVTYDAPTHVATFTPTSSLTASKQYTATVTTAAKDTAGNPLSPGTLNFTFTTAP